MKGVLKICSKYAVYFQNTFSQNTSGWLLLQHVETRIFVNKQDTLKQYKTSSKLNIFFKNKGVEIINLHEILQFKTVLSDMSKDVIPMVTTTKQIQAIQQQKLVYPKRKRSAMSP